MASIQVRAAALDDTHAISVIARSHITVWQRVNNSGQVEDVPYDTLSIYERWLHGGPWMSVETGAIHLSHLLRGAGIPVVAVMNGQVAAYAEAYHGVEPVPFGDHLHMGQLIVAAGSENSGLEDALLTHLLEQTRESGCQRLTAICIQGDSRTSELYHRHEMQPITQMGRLSLPAKSGQGFYKVVEHYNANPTQIAEWFMPAGRFGSARQSWETLWPRTFNALPEIAARKVNRVKFSASGQEAFLYCQQALYAPRNVEISLWSPKPLTSQMLTALRDWTHREGYRTLVMLVNDDTAKILGPEAEADGYYQEVFGVNV